MHRLITVPWFSFPELWHLHMDEHRVAGDLHILGSGAAQRERRGLCQCQQHHRQMADHQLYPESGLCL